MTRDDKTPGGLPYLATERLNLRPLQPGDAPDLARIAGDARVAPMIFIATVPWPVAEAEAVIARDQFRAGKLGFRLAICTRDGAMIGSIGVSTEPNIFYFFDPATWGHGYAREAVQVFSDALFETYGMEALGAEVFTENAASGKVLEACGFRRTGQGMATSRARLEPAPVFLYERRQLSKAPR